MNLEDIRQGANGDCFILSSLASILNSLGENIIDNIYQDDSNGIIFNYYQKMDNSLEKKNKLFEYDEKEFRISRKSKEWVRKIEYCYIKQFYNGSIENLTANGGISYQVLERLLGVPSKILINRILDNKEKLYYEICNQFIIKDSWNIDFIKCLNLLTKSSVTIFIERLWRVLTKDISEIKSDNIYQVKVPCVVGVNGVFNKITIPGVINEHLYSVVGFFIDSYGNKFLQVFNPHHNVLARYTTYDVEKDIFLSETKIDRYSIWSFYEIAIFVSDITYSQY